MLPVISIHPRSQEFGALGYRDLLNAKGFAVPENPMRRLFGLFSGVERH
jgi:hypothetical protein